MMKDLQVQKQKLLIKPFIVPIYDWTVVLLIGEESAAMNLVEGVESVKLYNSDCGVYLGSTFQPNSTVYVWYPEDAELTTKCHEILHATFHVLESVGVDTTNQEAVCYLFEYILKQCLDLENEWRTQTEVVSKEEQGEVIAQ